MANVSEKPPPPAVHFHDALIEVIEEQAVTKVRDPNARRPEMDKMARFVSKRAYEHALVDSSLAESMLNKKKEDEIKVRPTARHGHTRQRHSPTHPRLHASDAARARLRRCSGA